MINLAKLFGSDDELVYITLSLAARCIVNKDSAMGRKL